MSYESKQPPKPPVFFVDKCLGLKTVPEALRAAGELVERKSDWFAENSLDSEWLPEVGKKGWVVLSKDKQLRYNHLEILALLKSGTHAFILTSGNQTGAGMAKSIVMALPQIKGIIRKMQPPVVATISEGGVVAVKYTYEQLVDAAERTSPRKSS